MHGLGAMALDRAWNALCPSHLALHGGMEPPAGERRGAMHMSRQVMDGMIIAAALALGASHLYAQGFAGPKVLHANAAGGTTDSAARGVKGPNGGAAVAGHGVTTDGQGNAAGGSAAAVKGPSGGMGARAGRWTHAADGSTQHQSGGAVSGARGKMASSGSMTRGADGSMSGARNTTATASSGATYQGQTTYDKGSGATHTSTCTNAVGAVVPCTK
jgi:hypothetical protein